MLKKDYLSFAVLNLYRCCIYLVFCYLFNPLDGDMYLNIANNSSGWLVEQFGNCLFLTNLCCQNIAMVIKL